MCKAVVEWTLKLEKARYRDQLGKKHLPAQLMIDTALGALARNATSHILRKKIAFHPP
jgi:hypothetical protein